MFEAMFRIAKDKLAEINEKADDLPSGQVTVLLTDQNNLYAAVNDLDGFICKRLKQENDTKIVCVLAMWREGNVDLPSIKFRNALIAMDAYNKDADIILQGKKGYLIKKLAATMP